MKATLTIDGKLVRVPEGLPLIEAARTLGIQIPTLCYHELLKPYGACRLCVVEIRKAGRIRLVTSCNYPSEDGLQVHTNNAAVRASRRLTLELLLSRCPNVLTLQQMAKRLGVVSSRFKLHGDQQCILCGLCVRACSEMVSAHAIGLGDRGIDRTVVTPFGETTESCIGCGTCSYICPTGCIEMVSDGGGMSLKMDGHTLPECTGDFVCGECEIDRGFMEEAKQAIAEFRKARKSS